MGLGASPLHPEGRAIILTEISHPLRDTRRKWRLFHERVTAGASLETALPSVGWSIDHEPRHKKQLSAHTLTQHAKKHYQYQYVTHEIHNPLR